MDVTTGQTTETRTSRKETVLQGEVGISAKTNVHEHQGKPAQNKTVGDETTEEKTIKEKTIGPQSSDNEKESLNHKTICYSFVVDSSSPSQLKLEDKVLDVEFSKEVKTCEASEKEQSSDTETETSTSEATISAKKQPGEAICYSFVVDPSSPSHLKLKDKIFDVDFSKDVGYYPRNFMEMTTDYTDSKYTASKKVAADFGVEGNYGAFSGSASMNVTHDTESLIKTVRLDAKCLAGIALISPIGDFNCFPHEKLSKSFKKAVETLSCDDFATRVGIFYATDIYLGGRIRKSYTMQATEEDDEASVKAELEASYGVGCWGTTGITSNSLTKRTSNENSIMKTEWRAQGGNTKAWLGLSFGPNDNNAESVAKKWAESVNTSNAYPINMTLKPIWELVKKVDAQKGSELEAHLTGKWSTDASLFNPKDFLPSRPNISAHKKSTEILEKIQLHYDWLMDEKATAQSWVDTWYAYAHIKRNKKWMAACDASMAAMTAITDKVRKSDLTEKEFKAWIHLQGKKFDVESQRHLGCCGCRSAHSNRIYRKNSLLVHEILKMLDDQAKEV